MSIASESASVLARRVFDSGFTPAHMQLFTAVATLPAAHPQLGPAMEPTPRTQPELATAYCIAIAAPDDTPEIVTSFRLPARLKPWLSAWAKWNAHPNTTSSTVKRITASPSPIGYGDYGHAVAPRQYSDCGIFNNDMTVFLLCAKTKENSSWRGSQQSPMCRAAAAITATMQTSSPHTGGAVARQGGETLKEPRYAPSATPQPVPRIPIPQNIPRPPRRVDSNRQSQRRPTTGVRRFVNSVGGNP